MRVSFAAVLTIIALPILFAELNLTCNQSPSVPMGLWRLTHQPLAHGAYVRLKAPMKEIAGMAGDTVRVTPQGSYINGELWPDSAPVGAYHCPFGEYHLQPGELWLMSVDPRGWDSRYYCAIPESLVDSTATLLIGETSD
jgi:type IV secretory pathway protease TraF